MPINSGDWSKPADKTNFNGGIDPANTEHPQGYANAAMAKMPSYIGTKIVCATPMDEITFLTTVKGTDVGDRENMHGYLVVYEDGYKSWSPKNVFERSYRLITDAERRLI